ncbi:uncharacterized protein [Nicotiana tomentosiformis]|uniref:uncharacterized protein n=1 Tax=Nicotiana tomentosiformis TaxID=4098 RepID=UPI00388CC205
MNARKADIFRIAQEEFELLQESVTRFQKERMLLPDVSNEWAAETFTKGLNPRSSDASLKLKKCLLEFQATTWADVHNRYESKIRIEDDQLGFSTSTKGRDWEKIKEKSKDDFESDRRSSRGQVLPYERAEGCSRGFRSADRLQPKGELIMAGITSHCRTRRYRVPEIPPTPGFPNTTLTSTLWSWGNEINGVTLSTAKKMKISVTHSKRLREVTEDDIAFMEEYPDGLLLPHNDALVISLNVLDFKIKHVLVDPGSSTNIIQWRVLEQAKLTGGIISTTKLLVRFNLANVITRGEILLPTNAGAGGEGGGDEDDPFRGSGRRYRLQYYLRETMVVQDEGRTFNISSIAEVDQPVAKEMNDLSFQ